MPSINHNVIKLNTHQNSQVEKDIQYQELTRT